jgi:tape measure domain-containing protein
MNSRRFSLFADVIGVDKISRPLSRMQARMNKFSRVSSRHIDRLNRRFNKFARTIGLTGQNLKRLAIGGLGLLTGAVVGVVKAFSMFENARTGFEPLMGSAEGAAEMVEKLKREAESTPFAFRHVAASAKILLAMGAATKDSVIPTMRLLGDLTSGDAESFRNLSINFAEISANGKAMSKDLRQFTTAGVPLVSVIAKMSKTTQAEVFEMASRGEVSFKMVLAAMKELTKEGATFHDTMTKASLTLTGRWNTLTDKILGVSDGIGKKLAPHVKQLVEYMITATDTASAWLSANEALVTQWVDGFVEGLKTSIRFIKEHGATIAKAIAWFVGLMAVLKAFIIVMTAVNIVMAMNPLGLMVLGFVALGVAVGAVIIWWDKAKAAFMSFADSGLSNVLFLMGPIGMLIGAANMVRKHWEPISSFFVKMWDKITTGAKALARVVQGLIPDWVRKAIDYVAGGGTPMEDNTTRRRSQRSEASGVVSPEQAVARSISESRETSELVISGATDNVELKRRRGSAGGRSRITLQPSGAM